MAYASNSDIQGFFGEDKITVSDASTYKVKVDADRLIRGQLAGVITPLTLFSWTTPGNTPELIRGISGRLCAAFLYRTIYSEEQTEVPAYAQELYNEAISLLQGIKNGDETIIGVDLTVLDTEGGGLSFWPNDDNPMFSVNDRFS